MTTPGIATRKTFVPNSSPFLGLDDGPSDMLSPENAGPSTSVDLQTVVQLVNKGGMTKFLWVGALLAEMLMRLGKIGNRSAVSQLAEALHDLTFSMDTFRSVIKDVKYKRW